MPPSSTEKPTRPRKKMGIDDVTIGRIAQAVESIETATIKITAAIYDRGGLVERAALMEEAARQVKEEAAKVSEFRAHTTLVLDGIKDSVEAHHSDKSLHTAEGLLLRKNVLSTIMLVFLVIHTLIPPDINVFELIKKLAGL